MKETKEEVKETKKIFKQNLLEKVYAIGYYLLLASDSSYSVGKTGGEEIRRLTVDEMPCHSHQYKEIKYPIIKVKHQL